MCRKFNLFIIKFEIFRVLLHRSSCGEVDNVSRYHAGGHAFESHSEPFFIKILTYRPGGRLSPHVQTVLTSLMSKLVKNVLECRFPIIHTSLRFLRFQKIFHFYTSLTKNSISKLFKFIISTSKFKKGVRICQILSKWSSQRVPVFSLN